MYWHRFGAMLYALAMHDYGGAAFAWAETSCELIAAPHNAKGSRYCSVYCGLQPSPVAVDAMLQDWQQLAEGAEGMLFAFLPPALYLELPP